MASDQDLLHCSWKLCVCLHSWIYCLHFQQIVFWRKCFPWVTCGCYPSGLDSCVHQSHYLHLFSTDSFARKSAEYWRLTTKGTLLRIHLPLSSVVLLLILVSIQSIQFYQNEAFSEDSVWCYFSPILFREAKMKYLFTYSLKMQPNLIISIDVHLWVLEYFWFW